MFKAREYYSDILDEIKKSGLWKEERIITTPQDVYKRQVWNVDGLIF